MKNVTRDFANVLLPEFPFPCQMNIQRHSVCFVFRKTYGFSFILKPLRPIPRTADFLDFQSLKC